MRITQTTTVTTFEGTQEEYRRLTGNAPALMSDGRYYNQLNGETNEQYFERHAQNTSAYEEAMRETRANRARAAEEANRQAAAAASEQAARVMNEFKKRAQAAHDTGYEKGYQHGRHDMRAQKKHHIPPAPWRQNDFVDVTPIEDTALQGEGFGPNPNPPPTRWSSTGTLIPLLTYLWLMHSYIHPFVDHLLR